MSTFSLITIIIVFIIILILLIVVISILHKNNKPKKKLKKERIKVDFEKSSPADSLPSIKSVQFPANIEKMASDELYQITKNIYKSYRYFDYKNMDLDDLNKKEWHTWQVSILLKVYKMGDDFYIGNKDEVFHNLLLNSTEDRINAKMDAIIKHYVNFVNIDDTKDKLSKEYIWSNKDVSIIFYFLSNYKNYYR